MGNPNKIFEKTMKELWKLAAADGTITNQERDILEQIEIDAGEYAGILQESLDDGIIDNDEFERLEDLKDMIIERAHLVANVDNKLDKDEQDLITRLKEIMSTHYNLDLN